MTLAMLLNASLVKAQETRNRMGRKCGPQTARQSIGIGESIRVGRLRSCSTLDGEVLRRAGPRGWFPLRDSVDAGKRPKNALVFAVAEK